MRIWFWVVASLVAVAATSPALARVASDGCRSTVDATMPPNAGPYMPHLKMREPMPGRMKRDDMMIGDVAKSAVQRKECMRHVKTREEKIMDKRKQ